ncbi:MAG: gephyrin-like molybdotransferase Glp [Paracoccus sp. (in: a-proteobacteria)]|uniref:molybdopterin molybdotransferase MoeA n=1 Tax=Paracoccus sp. TaxID=267 RepID=UPI00391A0878
MITVDAALAHVLALAATPRAETVSLAQAYGRALLSAPPARLTQPPFDAAAMDGYALREADLPGPLDLIGESAAGHPWQGTPRPGTAIRIFTGAPVPPGYDRVEMQENTVRDGDRVTVTRPSQGRHIRAAGSDFSTGDRLAAGRRLSAADIGLLAAMNLPQIEVARRPEVAILAGGDELVPPGASPAAGQIISSNDLAIAALVTEAGGVPRLLPIARDTADSLRAGFAAAIGADLLVTIGGASVGDHDLIGKIAAEQGFERSFYKIAMRPGKPLLAGRLAGMPMLGLPGNPVSAITCAILFMQPLIRAMQGLAPMQPLLRARLGCDLGPEGPRQHYLRARLDGGCDLPCVTPFGDQDSARLSLLSQADVLMIRPAHDGPRRKGETIDCLPLSTQRLTFCSA